MLNNTEKPHFMNTRAVGVCPKVTVLSNGTGKKPYRYGILRKIGHGVDLS
jgi:hypothetical protein